MNHKLHRSLTRADITPRFEQFDKSTALKHRLSLEMFWWLEEMQRPDNSYPVPGDPDYVEFGDWLEAKDLELAS